MLASKLGERISYREIYRNIYGCDVEDSKNTIRVNISRLKKHLSMDDMSTYEIAATSDGSYVLAYRGGGKEYGSIKIEIQDLDGTNPNTWYTFYNGDTKWESFRLTSREGGYLRSVQDLTILRSYSLWTEEAAKEMQEITICLLMIS